MAFQIDGCPGIEVVQAATLAEACAMASRWRDDGRFDWFRGQTYPWPPSSGLRRREGDGSVPALGRFPQWLRENPAGALIGTDDQVQAVAQHFGVPTHFLDLTVDIGIAALFSRDRAPGRRYDGPQACLYCLDSDAMKRAWQSLPREVAIERQLYPVFVDLPELHRLQAQRGLFLHAPGAWWEGMPVTCLVFPRGEPLSEEEHGRLYPPTGRLEEEIKHFLRAVEVSEEVERISRLPGGVVVKMRAPSDLEARECFAGGDLPALRWPEPSSRHRPHRDETMLAFPPAADGHGDVSPAASMRGWLAQEIERRPELREAPLRFQVPAGRLLDEEAALALGRCMTRGWNAMADFPYSLEHRLDCMEALAIHASTPLAFWREGHDAFMGGLDAEAATSPRQRGDWCRIALHEDPGGYGEGLCGLGTLLGAVASEAAARLSPLGKDLLAREPLELFRRLRSPRRLFSYEALLAAFATTLVPTQLLTRPELPIIVAPDRLDYLGPP